MVGGCDFFSLLQRWALAIPFLPILNRNLCIQATRHPPHQSMWSAERERTSCEWEMSSLCDSHAVIVVKGEQIIGHLPWKILRLCSIFFGSGSSITVTVTRRMRRSVNLPKGGLEIPCGPEESISKVRSLMGEFNLLEDCGSCKEKKI